MRESEKKVALITGASSGIGLETSLRLLQKGWTVYGAARRTELLKKIDDAGGHGVFLDVTDFNSVRDCVQKVLAAEGQIDVLVNNAGYGLGGAIEDVSASDARNQLDVNLFGLIAVTKAVLPSMRKAGKGKIINISSMAGRFSTPFMGWYHASKYAVEALSDALRLEVKKFGIKVILVEPGFIRTDWGLIAAEKLRRISIGSVYEESAERSAAYYEHIYRGDIGVTTRPEKIAEKMVKIISAKRNRVRYAVGRSAKFYIFLKKILPDKMLDFITAKATGLK